MAVAGRLLVGERRGKAIGQDGLRTVIDVALVVRRSLDLVFSRNRFSLRRGKFRAALLREIAERNERERVAVLADFAIDLETALQLATVILAEWAGEAPLHRRRLRTFVFLRRRRRAQPDMPNVATRPICNRDVRLPWQRPS